MKVLGVQGSGRERKATRENSAGSNVEVESMEDTEYVNYFLEGREAPINFRRSQVFCGTTDLELLFC